jgi:hypothetical protein
MKVSILPVPTSKFTYIFFHCPLPSHLKKYEILPLQPNLSIPSASSLTSLIH